MATNILSVPSNMPFATILDEKFSAPIHNEDYKILTALKALHPSPATLHVALLDASFPLSAFLFAEGVDVQILDVPRHELVVWNAKAGGGSAAGLQQLGRASQNDSAIADVKKMEKGELYSRLLSGCMKFKYKDTDFMVYKVSWGHNILYDLVFDAPDHVVHEVKDKPSTQSAGHALVTAVYRWYQALKDEIWVFQDGLWAKDKALWAAICGASWEDIVLEQEFLDGLRRDTRTFFENREIYQELGVVWKRGLLLLGPPGNEKTESIKVLLKESDQATLYVKSFSTSRGPETGVRAIFDHARSNAPCILVIEDLDSLVTSNVRYFFLNELDGLGRNEGILTIATTNHPERIDDAILNRPSRFDVKYDFALPTESLRTTYALKWIRKIISMTASSGSSARKTTVRFERSDAELAAEVAKNTEGWSFAFLKELFVSFLLRLAHDKTRSLAQEHTEPSAQSLFSDSVLLDQVKALSNQILTVTSDGGDEDDSEGTKMGYHVLRKQLLARSSLQSAHPGANF